MRGVPLLKFACSGVVLTVGMGCVLALHVCRSAGTVRGAVGPGRPSSSAAKSPAGKGSAAAGSGVARAPAGAVSSPRLEGVDELNDAALEDEEDELGMMLDPALDDDDE